MADGAQPELGEVQRTLLFPLLARAKETVRRHPLLRDPVALEIVHAVDFDADTYAQGPRAVLVILRTMIFDWWVRQFLARFPGGTVAELGTGLNTRFERADNGLAHWIELDLPDTIELRRRFFDSTSRRTMVAASLLDEGWLDEVAARPGPYFFVAEGVLTYLREDEATAALGRIAARFPGAMLAFDTYPRAALRQEHRMAARRGWPAWQWACDDPRTLERLGLRLVETAAPARPPAGLRARLPGWYRYLLLPAARPLLAQSGTLSLFQAGPG